MFTRKETKILHLSPGLGLVSLLKCFIDILYRLCFCPFRLRWQFNEGKTTPARFTKDGWWVQKVFYFLGLAVAIFYCLKDIRYSELQQSSRNPEQYFQIVYKLTTLSSIIHFCALFMSRSNQTAFLNIANFMTNTKENYFPQSCQKLVNRLNISFVVFSGGYILNGFITLFMGNYASYSDTAGSSWWSEMVNEGRTIFFLQCSNVNQTRMSVSFEYILFGIAGFTGIFYRLKQNFIRYCCGFITKWLKLELTSFQAHDPSLRKGLLARCSDHILGCNENIYDKLASNLEGPNSFRETPKLFGNN